MNLDNGIQNAKKFGLRPRFASHEKHFRNSQNAFIYPPNRQAKVVPYLLEKIEFPFCLISYFFLKNAIVQAILLENTTNRQNLQ